MMFKKQQKLDDNQEATKIKELTKIVSDEEEVTIDLIPLATKPPTIQEDISVQVLIHAHQSGKNNFESGNNVYNCTSSKGIMRDIMKTIKGSSHFEIGNVSSDVIAGETEGGKYKQASSNARNKAMVQDGKVVVQDVRGRYNATNQGRPFQRNNTRGNGVAGNVELNRGGNDILVKRNHQVSTTVTNVDDDVDDSTENDLALNVDHIFEADECDAFDSDVDEGPTSQTMFMASLTSEDPIYDEAGPSYDSNDPFEVQDHDAFVRFMMDESTKKGGGQMSILDEMHEQGVQSRLTNKPDMVMNDSVNLWKSCEI
ncbi:hypothetical protein Tco_0681631 [Tanacetum coccineum]|uniref:Uncharacterized protein n=1 Tax=Tanacetum coccineum TaxID=301880 RepID=A0ABQ4XNW9_9ASTR